MDVLVVGASPRAGGNTDLVCEYLAKKFSELGLNPVLVMLRNFRIEPCRGCRECLRRGFCIIEDDMRTLMEYLLRAKAIVIATPVYFNSVPSILKAFIDRTWCLRGKLRNKVGGVVAIGRRYGHEQAVNIVISFFLKHEMIVGFRGVYLYAFEKGEVLNDVEGLKDLEKLAKRIHELLKIFEVGISRASKAL